MRSPTRLAPSLLAVLVLAAPAQAAAADDRLAFGIAMGAPVRQLSGAKAFKPGWYNVAAPPAPDPRFDKVAVEAFAQTGVCVVQGVSALVTQDANGAKVRRAVDRLADDFSTRYGQPLKLDSCTGLACAPDAWGEDVQTGDRRYGYRWDVRGGPIRQVSVVVLAHSVSSFVYLVQYDSAQLTDCRSEELRTPEP